MKIYIVTPTYNALEWLPCCVRSVFDQATENVEVHHHVQDGVSTDGTPEWLEQWLHEHTDTPHYTFTYESCKDKGMYDAINKAWEKLPEDADITAHLNCDEQYLPHALEQVAQEFAKHPKAEIIVSSYIVTDKEGRYICHRRPQQPAKWKSRFRIEIITCACFHRAEPFRHHKIRFDTQWKAIGDFYFYREIIFAGVRVKCLPPLMTSLFTVTGNNLAWSHVMQEERDRSFKTNLWYTLQSRFVSYWCSASRYLNDMLHSKPTSYSLYKDKEEKRTQVIIKRPIHHWGCRSEGEQ